MGWAATSRRIRRWMHCALIVPAAHTRVLDAELQSELYEVFHTRALSRWGHALCTPVINVALLALCGEVTVQLATGGGRVAMDGALAGAAIALAFYVAVHGAWALAMTPLLGIAVLCAHGLREALGAHAAEGALTIALGGALLQTLSHAVEPIPPPWSRGHAFRTAREVLTGSPTSRLITLVLASLFVFPLLELWASPRIWPLQLAQALERGGWLRARAARLRERARAIHRDARAGWELP